MKDLYPLTDEQIADMIEFEKLCEAEYQASILRNTPSYVEQKAKEFANEYPSIPSEPDN